MDALKALYPLSSAKNPVLIKTDDAAIAIPPQMTSEELVKLAQLDLKQRNNFPPIEQMRFSPFGFKRVSISS